MQKLSGHLHCVVRFPETEEKSPKIVEKEDDTKVVQRKSYPVFSIVS
jgi:hypothetical protein